MNFTWTVPAPDGEIAAEELLVSFDTGSDLRVLVLPAWFDEANKLRRFTVEVMRRLARAGIDSFLPDLPGCNESLAPLSAQTVAGWQDLARAAAQSLGATHVLTIRGGALIAPDLPGWQYAAQSGPKLLRAMIRARIIAAREEGRPEASEALVAHGRLHGLVLNGWDIGPAMLRELEGAEPVAAPAQQEIAQAALGGPGLWLRAEPDEDAPQADALAAIIAGSLA